MQSTQGSSGRPAPPPPPPKPKALSSNAATAAAGHGGSRKRGLGWPWDHPGQQLQLYRRYAEAGKIGWLFNWEVWVPESLPEEIEWVPCVRTAATAREQLIPFLTDIIQNRGIHTSALLGFNEPEIPEQAHLPPHEAVELWRQFVVPAKHKFGLRLGSPGMSSDVSRSKPWLDSFLDALEGKDEIDFLVVHWYGPHFADMKAFLEDMHRTYRLPVWVNEFACTKMGAGEATPAEVEAFLRESLPWLESCDWVERYAYFGNNDVGSWVGKGSNFTQVDQAGQRTLTAVGKLYCEL